MSYRIYGIRHHGPGSARNLIKALDKQKPEVIFIEMPRDIQKIVDRTEFSQIIPPVALISFNTKNPEEHLFLPFAEFSPEWQALLYGNSYDIPVYCIDIPTDVFLSLSKEKKTGYTLSDRGKDPLNTFAKIAGFRDVEAWWEQTFEIYDQADVVFDIITELMREFRSESNHQSEEGLLREAHMRVEISKNYKKYDEIAVICGAFHVPALESLTKNVIKEDKKALKKINSKISTDTRFIPWSYHRLAQSKGYKSGVKSPAWYETLWKSDEDMHLDWLIRAAKLLRNKNHPISPAHVIDASSILKQLLSLRERSHPSISDVLDVIKSSMCNGKQELYDSIEDELLIGSKTGEIPEGIDQHPIIDDFYRMTRKARLTKYIENKETYVKKLDLRKDLHQEVSQFFHQLGILQINFADEEAENERSKGSFSENWLIPPVDDELDIEISKAGLYGHDIATAAQNYVDIRLQNTDSIPELIHLLKTALKARLSNIQSLGDKIYSIAFKTSDISSIMELCIELTPIKKLGSVYEYDTDFIDRILNYSFRKVIASLGSIYNEIDNDIAVAEKNRMNSFQFALFQMNDEKLNSLWDQALLSIYEAETAHRMILGLVTRMLIDRKKLNTNILRKLLQRFTSSPNTAQESVMWLEGLLSGNAYRILRSNDLLNTLDIWIRQLSPQDFMELLPVMRRTFSSMKSREKITLFQSIQDIHSGLGTSKTDSKELTNIRDESRDEKELPELYELLLKT